MPRPNKILDINNLHLSFDTYAGEVRVLRGVTLQLYEHETLAIVGESGSGKSVTVQAIMQLNPTPPARIIDGSIVFENSDLLKYSEKDMQKVRGSKIGMIFQNPMGALNPTMRVGKQIAESIRIHEKISYRDSFRKSVKLLKLVGVSEPEKRAKQYPHQFSGGMRQRVVTAIALACKPKILVADEPTTALDVTIQAQILKLIKDIKAKLGTSVILITHDLAVVAETADRVAVMYGGEIIEEAPVKEIFSCPKHPYTWGLINSIPKTERNFCLPLTSIDGTPPDLLKPPTGCSFAPRCQYCMKVCLTQKPYNFTASEKHNSKCWLMHKSAPHIEFNNPYLRH